MSKLKILLAAVLCMSLLAFTGCGENNNTDTNGNNGDNGTVTQESTDMNDDARNGNNDDSLMEDMENGADDMVDGLERDAKDAADGMRNAVDGNNGEGPSNRDKNTKGSN